VWKSSKIDKSIDEYELQRRIDVLQAIGIFSDTKEKVLKEIAISLKPQSTDEGTVLFHKGDERDAMYFIVEGSIIIHDGDYIYRTLCRGEFFGEYALIDPAVRSTSATTVTKSELLLLDQKTFNDIMSNKIEVSREILKILIRRLRDYNVLEANLNQRSIEIKRQKHELEHQHKKLRELNATKDKFFSIVAHDLKNPIGALTSLLELLHSNFDSWEHDQLKSFVQEIYQHSGNIMNLLENLLVWSKSQRDMITIEKEKFSLVEIISTTLDLMMSYCQQKNIIINYLNNSSDDCKVIADKNMILTVVRNLISNAIKYSFPASEIDVAIYQNDSQIVFSVKDNGVGIDKSNINKLFRIDVNYTTTGTANETGTGLGLILCKEFISKNDGDIWVESQSGKGSTFKFWLPIAK